MLAEERLFSLNTHGDHYFTGSDAQGQQILMGLLPPCVVAYFFDANGNLQGCEARDWQHPAPRFPNSDIWRIGNAEFKRHLAAQIAQWQGEIGFTPGAIQVRWFWDEEFSVGLATLPESLRDLSWCEDEAQRQEMASEIAAWQAEGQFVFSWTKEYLISVGLIPRSLLRYGN